MTGATMTDTPTEAGSPRTRRAGPRSESPWRWVTAVVAVVAVALAAWLAIELRWARAELTDLRAAAQAETDVQAATVELMRVLTNWDAQDPGLQQTRDQLAAMATGDFRDQIDEIFGGGVAADLEATRARSIGELRDVYVQQIEGDRAEAFVVADQTVTSDDAAQPLEVTRRAEVVLRQVDGAWKVSVVTIVDGIVPLDGL
jgi:multidrug efflux pump subunit AcrB